MTKVQEAKERKEEGELKEKYSLSRMEDIINEYQTGMEVPQVTDENPGVLEEDEKGDNTYIINSIEDLVVFSYNVRNGNSYTGKTVRLGRSLDFNSTKSYVEAYRTDYSEYGYNGELKTAITTGEGFKPIGEITPTDTEDHTGYFDGTFDGENNVISNLYINVEEKDSSVSVGLFSCNYGTIQNLGLLNVNISASGLDKFVTVGGIAAHNYNAINKCYITGNIKSAGITYVQAGGICAIMEKASSIELCGNKSNVIAQYYENSSTAGDGTGNAAVGGIVGQSSTDAELINKCYNIGNVEADGKDKLEVYCGGIIGFNRNKIKNSYNTGRIEGISNKQLSIGGISGHAYSYTDNPNVSNCYNVGEIKATGTKPGTVYVGGILGYNYDMTMTNVFNIGEIKIDVKIENLENLENFRVGGLAGGAWLGHISYGYNIGNISIENENIQSGNIGIGIGIGSIIGIKMRGTSNLTNCGYLKNSYEGVGIQEDVINPDIKVEGEEDVEEIENVNDFPSVLKVVNNVVNEEEAFASDVNNINGGYPIIKTE